MMLEEEIVEPLVYDDEKVEEEIALPPAKRRRGKAIAWKFVKKFPTIEEAKEEFTRSNLTENEQFLGRKYTGKTSAIYINCQKVVCGCNKKWRLVSSHTTSEVVLEETSEDHSKHELFLRGGGNGLSTQQALITQEALAQNSRMKPLQILNYFRDKALKALSLDPNATTVIAPEIVRLSSYLSYQRRKLSGALAVTNQKKSAAKLAQADFPLSEIKSSSSSKRQKVDNEEYCGNNSCLIPKKDSSEEDLLQWTKCTKSKCTLQFCPKCATESEEHALVCRQPNA